jgi:hypothetical protein
MDFTIATSRTEGDFDASAVLAQRVLVLAESK